MDVSLIDTSEGSGKLKNRFKFEGHNFSECEIVEMSLFLYSVQDGTILFEENHPYLSDDVSQMMKK